MKKPFANIADEFGISPTTVKRIFTEYVKEQKELLSTSWAVPVDWCPKCDVALSKDAKKIGKEHFIN